MNDWNTVTRKKNKAKPKLKCYILQTFKISKCTIISKHNHLLCTGWHDDNDRRRDPYKIYYLPEEAMNPVEKAYHPLIYRTHTCPSITQQKTCKHGNTCSYAHGPIRTNPQYSKKATDFKIPMCPQALPSQLPSHCASRWNVQNTTQCGRSENIEMDLFQQYMATNPAFWKFLDNKTLEFACTIAMFGLQLRITGPNVSEAADTIRHKLHYPPVKFICLQKCKFRNNSILLKIGEKLKNEGPTCFGSSFVTVSREYVVVRAFNIIAAKSVIKQIRFWVEQEGLDKFVDCSVCYDSVSCHSTVVCPSGHIFCYHGEGDSCFTKLVGIALPTLKTQKSQQLPCPVCTELDAPFELKTIASRVSKPLWEKINAAIVDARVEDQTAKLRSDFDAKLQAKLQEMYSNHGNVGGMIKMKGEQLANRARNEILNLSCPHCKQPYAEFSGCMALKCESCHENFCGYCHKACKDSRGCHEHVRECDLNITHNHDYYASPSQIKVIQRRYRTKKLKKFLRQGNNREEQNAAIFELQQDLIDLGIDPGALLLLDAPELI